MQLGPVAGIEQHHRSAVVAGLLHELAGAVEVRPGRRPGPALVGDVPAEEDAGARAVVLGLADRRLQIRLLIDHMKESLAGLLVVERGVQVIRP